MMPSTASAFVGFRISVRMKESWERQALEDHRTLSSWIIHRIESVGPAHPDSTERPRRRRNKAMVG